MKSTVLTAFALAGAPQLAALVAQVAPPGSLWRDQLNALLWALASAGLAWLLQFIRSKGGPPPSGPFNDSGGS